LPQMVRIARDLARARIQDHLQADLLCFSGRPQHFNRGLNSGNQFKGTDAETKTSGYDPRNIEQIVNELVLRANVLKDHVEASLRPFLVKTSSLQERCPTTYRVQRAAEFVRYDGEELILAAVCLLGSSPREFSAA
jgi:hypothetical protein